MRAYLASGETCMTVLQSVAASDEANKVFNNPITAYKAKLASCEAKKASLSLNALQDHGKAKAQCSAKFQDCKAIVLLRSAKKASGKDSAHGGTKVAFGKASTSGGTKIKAFHKAKIASAMLQ